MDELPRYEYALRTRAGDVLSTGASKASLASLLRAGDELLRREVGEWEVVSDEV